MKFSSLIFCFQKGFIFRLVLRSDKYKNEVHLEDIKEDMWKEISLPRIASIKKQMTEGLGMFSATAQADTIMSKKLRQQHLKYSNWLYHQPNIEQQRSDLFDKI